IDLSKKHTKNIFINKPLVKLVSKLRYFKILISEVFLSDENKFINGSISENVKNSKNDKNKAKKAKVKIIFF
ncbi:hypothetical protein, partial [Candidatus Pelagibacter sp.]|uniref:hypothetical protein n=1 Tax=Candidatus Pelagibacter sp. TaxID=2024849 RepID=UPI003F8363E8